MECGSTPYSLPNEKGVVFISDITKSKSVTLLRTGNALDFEYREESLRVIVPANEQTDLPDMVKIIF